MTYTTFIGQLKRLTIWIITIVFIFRFRAIYTLVFIYASFEQRFFNGLLLAVLIGNTIQKVLAKYFPKTDGRMSLVGYAKLKRPLNLSRFFFENVSSKYCTAQYRHEIQLFRSSLRILSPAILTETITPTNAALLLPIISHARK